MKTKKIPIIIINSNIVSTNDPRVKGPLYLEEPAKTILIYDNENTEIQILIFASI